MVMSVMAAEGMVTVKGKLMGITVDLVIKGTFNCVIRTLKVVSLMHRTTDYAK